MPAGDLGSISSFSDLLLGGESPIANSLEIYERVKEELPEFVEELAKRGLTMRQVYPPAGHNRGNVRATHLMYNDAKVGCLLH